MQKTILKKIYIHNQLIGLFRNKQSSLHSSSTMDNIHLKSFTRQILPTSLMPLIAVTISYPLEHITIRFLHLTSKSIPSDNPVGGNSTQSSHLCIFTLTREILSNTYSSYAHFMIMMIFLHAALGTITYVVRHLADKLRSSKNLVNKEFQEDPKTMLSHLQRESTVKFQIPSLIQLEKWISYAIILLLQYSLVYYIYTTLCIVFSSLFYSYFYTVHQSENLLPRAYAGLERNFGDLPHQFLANPGYQTRIGNKYGDLRMLGAQETPDVVKVVGSIGLNESQRDIYELFQLNETRLWLFCERSIIPVDISDYTMPQMLKPINISIQEEEGKLTEYYVSPNGESIIRSYVTEGLSRMIYITNISNPQTTIKLDYSNDYGDLAFTPDSNGGYLAAADLFQFKTSSEKLQNVLLLDGMEADLMTISNDGKTIFIAVDLHDLEFDLQTINVTDPASSNILTSFGLEFAITSLALSSDNKILFILTNGDLQILDVSDPASPKKISSTTKLKGQSTLILSPDDESLIVDLGYIVDVSDPTNLIINPSNILSSALKSIFSRDSKAVFILTKTELQIATVFSNFIPEQQLSYTSFNLQIQDISLNSFSFSTAVSPDGKVAYVACEEGVQIFEIVNNTVLLYKEKIPGTLYAEAALLSKDGKTAFVRTLQQILIVNLTDKTLLSYIELIDSDDDDDNKFALSPDGKTIMFDRYTINVANLTNPGQPVLLLTQKIYAGDPIAINWEVLVIGSGNVFSVFNISDITSPDLIYQAETLNQDDSILDIAISPDNQTLFINTYSFSSGERSSPDLQYV